MDATGALLYQLVRNKDYAWVDMQVSQIRLYWTPIYPIEQGAINRRYLMCMQSMEKIEKKFKDSTFKKNETPFETLPVMYKIINRLAELLIQAPPKCEVKAGDPTAISGKAEEINLLRTRKIYENNLNKANKTIGEPPSKLDLSKANSNVADFDKLGLDDTDEQDLNEFEQYLQRMDFEIAAQEAINEIFKVNVFDEFNLREGLIDIGATLALGYEIYVDELTGQQVINRIPPEEQMGIWGSRYDGRDDTAKGWERPVTFRRFLGLVGDNFNMKRDWADLIWAINLCNTTRFTGFRFAEGNVMDTWNNGNHAQMHKDCGCTESKILTVDQAYHYNVFVGKCEWYAPDTVGDDYLVDRVDQSMQVSPISFSEWQGNKNMFEKYDLKTEIKWFAYQAIYLAFTTTTQKIYKWGKVYLQQPEGAYDEYAIGTLKYYRLPGRTIAEVAKPYIDTGNEAYYKIKWILNAAKPRAKQLVFNELIAMARALKIEKGGLTKKDGKVSNDSTDMLEEVFDFMDKHVEHEIRFYPQVQGRDIPQIPTIKSPDEGFDPLATALQLIEQWCEAQVMDKIGLYDLMNANPREGLGQQKLLTDYAKNQVGWLYRIFQFVKKDAATTILCYTHDVIKFKQSLASQWLKVLLGDEKFEGLKNLGKYAAHRMGIFINDYFTQKRKEEIDAAANIALQKGMQGAPGGITFAQWYSITSAEDYKREAKLLDIFLRKAEKKARKQALQDAQIKGDQEKAKDDRALALQREKIEGELKKEEMVTEAQKYVADKQYAAKMDTTTVKQEHEPTKQGLRTDSQKDLASHKANLEQQAAV